MRKLFGRKKKDGGSDFRNESNTLSSQPRTQPAAVLSVKPAYLNLTEFAFPAQARSLLAQARDEEILLDQCRRCSGVFVHTFMDWTTKIIVGVPQNENYRAISYVWGDVIQLPMKCNQCGHTFTIPMESTYKFRRLMMMTSKSGDSVWLDALSIDQTSKEDKNKIIAVMGDIYSRAHTVAVLFPEADADGFKIVWDLTQAATAINLHKLEFSQPGQDGHSDPRLEELTNVCQNFYNLLTQFDQNLHRYQYWRRAWTFQEWALSRNVSITWEGGMPMNLEPVKTTVLHAATTTAIYTLRQGAYAKIKMGFPQASVVSNFERVRRLFPDENAFVPPGLIDEDEISADMAFPSLRFKNALGLRTAMTLNFSQALNPPNVHEMYDLRSDLPQNQETRFLHRLNMALHAFGSSKREARYEADLVSCWASMCNIKYAYDVNDQLEAALQKVLWSIRLDQKLKIYNFCINTDGAGGEVDANFFEYACLHEQCNATLPGYKLHGLPILTGRADTAVHLRLALNRISPQPKLKGRGIQLRKLERAAVMSMTPMSNQSEVLSQLASAVIGTADGLMFNDVLQDISRVLQSTPSAQLNTSALAMAMVYVEPTPATNGAPWLLNAWAITPSGLDYQQCFVAKEALNDTLVVATEDATGARILAYLTLTDQQNGTMLINITDGPVSRSGGLCSSGQLDVTMKTSDRRGMTNSALLGTRYMRGPVLFNEGFCTAY